MSEITLKHYMLHALPPNNPINKYLKSNIWPFCPWSEFSSGCACFLLLDYFWCKLWIFCSTGHILISKVCFCNCRRDVEGALPWVAFFQEAASVPVSMEFEGVGWILYSAAWRQCRKLMDAIWVPFLRHETWDSFPLPSVKIHGMYFL